MFADPNNDGGDGNTMFAAQGAPYNIQAASGWYQLGNNNMNDMGGPWVDPNEYVFGLNSMSAYNNFPVSTVFDANTYSLYKYVISQ